MHDAYTEEYSMVNMADKRKYRMEEDMMKKEGSGTPQRYSTKSPFKQEAACCIAYGLGSITVIVYVCMCMCVKVGVLYVCIFYRAYYNYCGFNSPFLQEIFIRRQQQRQQ